LGTHENLRKLEQAYIDMYVCYKVSLINSLLQKLLTCISIRKAMMPVWWMDILLYYNALR